MDCIQRDTEWMRIDQFPIWWSAPSDAFLWQVSSVHSMPAVDRNAMLQWHVYTSDWTKREWVRKTRLLAVSSGSNSGCMFTRWTWITDDAYLFSNTLCDIHANRMNFKDTMDRESQFESTFLSTVHVSNTWIIILFEIDTMSSLTATATRPIWLGENTWSIDEDDESDREERKRRVAYWHGLNTWMMAFPEWLRVRMVEGMEM